MLWLLSPFNFLCSFSSIALVRPPHPNAPHLPHPHRFCNIISPSKSKTTLLFPLTFSYPSLLISSSCHQLTLAPTHLSCAFTLENAKPALARGVQHLRAFSGLTAAFVSHYIWTKYLPAPLQEKKLPPKSRKLPKLGNTPKDSFRRERLWGRFLTCVL